MRAIFRISTSASANRFCDNSHLGDSGKTLYETFIKKVSSVHRHAIFILMESTTNRRRRLKTEERWPVTFVANHEPATPPHPTDTVCMNKPRWPTGQHESATMGLPVQ